MQIDGIENSYSDYYFKEFKYLSGSNMNWREDVKSIVESEEYKRLHILTHPIWYNDIEKSKANCCANFLNDYNSRTYDEFTQIATDLSKILPYHKQF